MGNDFLEYFYVFSHSNFLLHGSWLRRYSFGKCPEMENKKMAIKWAKLEYKMIFEQFFSTSKTSSPCPHRICRFDRIRLLQPHQEQLQEGRAENVVGQPADFAVHGIRHLLRSWLHGTQKFRSLHSEVVDWKIT